MYSTKNSGYLHKFRYNANQAYKSQCNIVFFEKNMGLKLYVYMQPSCASCDMDTVPNKAKYGPDKARIGRYTSCNIQEYYE